MILKAIYKLYSRRYSSCQTWEVGCTDEFGNWWNGLTENAQEDVDVGIRLLEARGPRLGYPYSSKIQSSRHSHLRELRIRSSGKPLRIFYAFDPQRRAVLLVGGDKKGDDRFYQRLVPIADRLYDQHLEDSIAEDSIARTVRRASRGDEK